MTPDELTKKADWVKQIPGSGSFPFSFA